MVRRRLRQHPSETWPDHMPQRKRSCGDCSASIYHNQTADDGNGGGHEWEGLARSGRGRGRLCVQMTCMAEVFRPYTWEVWGLGGWMRLRRASEVLGYIASGTWFHFTPIRSTFNLSPRLVPMASRRHMEQGESHFSADSGE